VALGVNLYTHSSYYQLSDPKDLEWDFVEAALPGVRQRVAPWQTDWTQNIPWEVNALPHDLARARMTYFDSEKYPVNDSENDFKNPGVSTYSGPSPEALLQSDQELTRRYRNWAWGHPLAFLRAGWNEALRLWAKCEEYYPESLLRHLGLGAGAVQEVGVRLERGLLYQPLWLLAFLALPVWLTSARNLAGPLFIALLLYGSLLPLVQMGFTRYSLPMIPGWLALAAAGISQVWKRVKPVP
jgi:hypothetical protein